MEGDLDRERPRLERVIRHLQRHGVKAQPEESPRGDISVSDVLLSRAADLGADTIVAEAYHHSPLRETLLGRVSRDLLDHMTVPVLMSHWIELVRETCSDREFLHHSVVQTGCSATLLDSRVVPRYTTQLTAVFLDRKVEAILGHHRNTRISRQQREELAAVIHPCGTGPAKAFARRAFRLTPGERCGDHDVAAYVAQINAMKRKLLHLAADE